MVPPLAKHKQDSKAKRTNISSICQVQQTTDNAKILVESGISKESTSTFELWAPLALAWVRCRFQSNQETGVTWAKRSPRDALLTSALSRKQFLLLSNPQPKQQPALIRIDRQWCQVEVSTMKEDNLDVDRPSSIEKCSMVIHSALSRIKSYYCQKSI